MRPDCLASANPLEHVIDHIWKQVGGEGPFSSFTIMSNHVFMMLVAAAIMLLALPRLARVPEGGSEVERMTPRGGRNMVETVCTFLRDFVARPTMGDHTDRFIPYVWTAFFFILTVNLLGLLPLEPLTKPLAVNVLHLEHGIYGTPTGNIWTTSTLAICTFVMIVFNGLRLHGLAYVKHFFMGPFPISIVIGLLEMVGLLAKTFALAVRLFANMMAGHILLAVLVSFIATAGAVSTVLGFGVAVPVVLGSAAITLLELFVAFLQAFIFTFLSCVFIGQAVNIHHEHHEGHDEAHGPHGEAVAH
jgi:F-type H+-transporting ATPase subunit a